MALSSQSQSISLSSFRQTRNTFMIACTKTEEIEIETRSATGRTHRTIIWVVVDDNVVYVRSVRGRNGRWYQEATANPDAAIHVNRQHFAVHAVPVADQAFIARVSNGYMRKDRDDPALNSMV